MHTGSASGPHILWSLDPDSGLDKE